MRICKISTFFRDFPEITDRFSHINYLKPLQAKNVKSALAGDTLIVLPTGYGKSLIFELVPFITNSKAVIVSPLNAIIEEQCQRLGDSSIHINATLTSELHDKEGMLNYSVIQVSVYIIEPPHRKTNNLHRRKQRRRTATAKLISAFAFAIRIES